MDKVSINRMEAVIWILLPGFTAVASGLLAWFIMQSRMEVALARERERTAESRGALDAEKSALGASLDTALRAAEAVAKREALEGFMDVDDFGGPFVRNYESFVERNLARAAPTLGVVSAAGVINQDSAHH